MSRTTDQPQSPSAGATQQQPATVVLQSHQQPLPHAWLQSCLDSVRDWAQATGYRYRFIDDALFSVLTEVERRSCAAQPVVASDLARLRWCQRLLREGAERVVWCDADTLMLDGAELALPVSGCAFGRELWLQGKPTAPKLYRKIHNACMVFNQGDPVLDFYAYSAMRLITNHAASSAPAQTESPHTEAPQITMVPQLAGPKFLTHLHNVVQFPVLEAAQVVSPLLAFALLRKAPNQEAAGDQVLRCYRAAWRQPPAALNLCASEVARGAVSSSEMTLLIERLSADGLGLFESWPPVR